jgi:AhpD family alkylhydroperoxidase
MHPMKQPRLNPYASSPEAMEELLSLQEYTQTAGLEASLIELLGTRVSQLNGCAHGIWRHTRRARQLGEAEQRLCSLDAWRGTNFFSERERAALAWAEAVTLVPQAPISEETFAEVYRCFTEAEVVELTLLVAATNAWNRMEISFGQHFPFPDDVECHYSEIPAG